MSYRTIIVLLLSVASVSVQAIDPRLTVTNTSDSHEVGLGSLRDAIAYANANPNSTISFNITEGGTALVKTITLTNSLPIITATGLLLMGYTAGMDCG